MRCLFAMIAFLALVGCDQESPEPSDVSPAVSQDAAIPICWIKRHGKEAVVYLDQPYACFLGWNEKTFILYSKAEGIVFRTSEYAAFLEALRQLPNGAEILQIDFCSGGAMYGMPESDSEKLSMVMQEGKRSWAEWKFNGMARQIVCICESDGIRFPDSTRR